MQHSLSSIFAMTRTYALTGAALVMLSNSAFADVDSTRGQSLYENHCGTCHDTNVHKRESHIVQSMDELRVWVAAMGAHTGLDWRAEDIGDVAFYLNLRIYRFGK